MKPSDYLAESKKLREASLALREQYIQENAQFAVGERVIIAGHHHGKETTRFAEVRAVTVSDYDGSINYKLKKVKLDGTLSKHDDYVWTAYETIQKI